MRSDRHDTAGRSTMHVPHTSNRREPLPCQTLLHERLLIQPQTRDVLSERKRRSSKREELAILVLELVPDRRLRPAPRRVVALIEEAGAIDVRRRQERTIKGRSETAAIGDRVLVQPAAVVLVSRQPVLPPSRS